MSESFADFRREPSKPHQCMYYDDGRQCRAWSMHNEFFCYRHRTTPVQPVIENDPFEIARLDSRPAIQQALADVAGRLAANRMDLKRAGLLIYTLQLASHNLAGPTSAPPSTLDPPSIAAPDTSGNPTQIRTAYFEPPDPCIR